MRHRFDAGFTLVEVMMTVAIVGILAAVAVPAWGRAVARSRQTEATSNLSTIYDLEVIYKHEFNSYGTLLQIGFVPEGANRYSYCAGDPADAGACVQSATDQFDFGSGNGGFGAPPTGGPTGPAPDTTPVFPPQGIPSALETHPDFRYGAAGDAPLLVAGGNPHADSQSFEADAYGKISAASPPFDVDRWLVDTNKTFVNYTVGY